MERAQLARLTSPLAGAQLWSGGCSRWCTCERWPWRFPGEMNMRWPIWRLVRPAVMWHTTWSSVGSGSPSRSRRAGQHRQSPVETDLWLGNDGVAATVARAKTAIPKRLQAGRRRSVDRPLCSPAGGRRPRTAASQARAGNVTGTDVLIDGELVKGPVTRSDSGRLPASRQMEGRGLREDWFSWTRRPP